MNLSKWAILIVIIICFTVASFLILNPAGWFDKVDKNYSTYAIILGLVLIIVMIVMEKPISKKGKLKKAKEKAEMFIFENYRQDVSNNFIRHKLTKDELGNVVFLLEYRTRAGRIISLLYDISTKEITEHHPAMAPTPPSDHKEKLFEEMMQKRSKK